MCPSDFRLRQWRVVIPGVLLLVAATLACGPLIGATPTPTPTVTPLPPPTATPSPTPPPGPYAGLYQELDRSAQGVGLAIGAPDAPVTLTEYADFSCPHCHSLFPTIERLIAQYVVTGQLRIVFKPISFVYPPYSTMAASAAVCGAGQGRGWDMVARIWELYEASGPTGYDRAKLSLRAQIIGLDMDQFETCLTSAETAGMVQGVVDEALANGIYGVPAVFVNGEEVGYYGPDRAYGDLSAAIEDALGQQ